RSKRDWSSDVCSSDLLDGGDLDSPVLRAFVDDLPQQLVDLLAIREQLVELYLAEHREQRRLRELARRVQIVLDLHHGQRGIGDRSEERRVGKEGRARG